MNSDPKVRGLKRRLESSAAAAAAAGLRAKHLNSGQLQRSPLLLSSAPASPAPAPASSSPPPPATAAPSSSSSSSSSHASVVSVAAKVSSLSSLPLDSLSLCKIRQLVFNLSMCKLSRFRQTPDPSLVRSVLICNTLKRLERELDREGIRISFGPNGVSFGSPASSPTAAASPTDQSSLPPSSSSPALSLPPQPPLRLRDTEDIEIMAIGDLPREPSKFSPQDHSPSGRLTPFLRQQEEEKGSQSPRQQPVAPEETCAADNDSGRWSPEPAQALSASSWTAESMSFSSGDEETEEEGSAIDVCDEGPERPTPAPASPAVESAPSLLLLHELRPRATASDSPAAAAAEATTTAKAAVAARTEAEVTSVKATLRCKTAATDAPSCSPADVPVAPAAPAPTPAAPATTEEIFGDIDLSLYDFDLLSPIAAPVVKMTPISAEELMRSITPAPDNPTCSPQTSPPVVSVHPASLSPQPPTAPLAAAATATTVPSSPSPSPSSSSSSSPSTSCATQSSASVAFSKLFVNKKDPLFLDDLPTAIS